MPHIRSKDLKTGPRFALKWVLSPFLEVRYRGHMKVKSKSFEIFAKNKIFVVSCENFRGENILEQKWWPSEHGCPTIKIA